ncbi:AfsR/SARP family transcriptional regulator [Actinospica robiniae]|uniref:DNA-binding transcriptional activator of the SARP family n=1 Tax=Actinospica robiniae DSM 44927 TaxID=479430 RepID=W9DW84_9ACTN|nr:AfsR/SARP family transcriptional regulator [Actinospica robiniae]ETA71079.1 DNA-binding transcriptional activator of the SARP family [Actinospica robiniae DSM 44927]
MEKARSAADLAGAEAARTRIAVLGPVQVWHEDCATRIKGARPQALLTVLLLEANRVVTLERLAELIWERPPASATANLRTYACRLRSALDGALGPAGARRLTATPSGYRLQVAAEESDICVFAQRMRRGLELSAGDPAAAAGYLESALGLWRGAAAEDVPRTQGLAGRLAALEDQRHRATEHLMQARLALGEHERLVGRLHELAVAHPTRERFWCQLIVANYRCGDPAAAISAFEQARQVLRRELGIAPGPEMTELYRRVLHRDPLLHAASRDGAWFASQHSVSLRERAILTPVVAEQAEKINGTGQDAANELFVGRADELARLLDHLAAPSAPHAPAAQRLAVISGGAGIGKSALAAKVARVLDGLGHARCIVLDLRGTTMGRAPLAPAVALRRLRELRGEAAGAEPLVVLDNAASAEQVSPLIQALAPCPVLITSRSVLATFGSAMRIDLAPLPLAESRRLLAALCGEQRTEGERDQIDALVRACGGLPLALHIAGTRLAARPEWSVTAFAEILADERCRLDELCGDGLSVRASFAVSYRALTEATGAAGAAAERAARLFGRLGRAGSTFVDADRAAGILGCDRVPAAAALGRLADARLLEPAGAGGYRISELMRLFAAEQLDRGEEQDEPGRHCARTRPVPRDVDVSCYRPSSLLRTTPSSRSVGR